MIKIPKLKLLFFIFLIGIISTLSVQVFARGSFINSFGNKNIFNYSYGDVVLPDGNLLVTDNIDNKLQVFSPNGNLVSTFIKPKTKINLQTVSNSNLLDTAVVDTQAISHSSSNASNIFLNNYPHYVSGLGQNLALNNGQVITFEVLNELHSLTVNKITSDSITFTLRSSPKQETLKVGQTGSYDVAGQSQNNIKIRLNSIVNNQANLTFSAIKYPVKIVSPAVSTKPSSSSYYVPILVIIILASFLVWYLRRAKQRSKIKS